MRSIVLIALFLLVNTCLAANPFATTCDSASVTSCCGGGSAHFFSSPKVCRCMRCRFRDRFHLLGLDSQLFSGDQPVHMPYDTWNVYYYDRPYQFRQSDAHQLLPSDIGASGRKARRERMLDVYEQRTLENLPTVGNVDRLEYSILPGERY